MKWEIFLFAILLNPVICKSQQSKPEEIYFLGYKNNDAIFSGENGLLFTLSELGSSSFTFLDSGNLSFSPPKYVGAVELHNNTIRYVLTFGVPFQIIFETESTLIRQEVFFSPKHTVTDFKNNTVYLSQESDNPDYYISLPIKTLDTNSGKVVELPINGIMPTLGGDYLFYGDYPNPKQFDLVYDIYRVKIGDWENPKKVFQKNYMNSWGVSPDGKYLVAEVINAGYKPQPVLFNIEEKRYAKIEIGNLPEIFFFSKQKQEFCFLDFTLNNGDRRFIYYPIPKEFPFTPDWAMDFGESFINNNLLEEADEDILRSLDKAQLRLLRNAIFARRGWRFNDPELSNFFKQFEWYNHQINLYENNSEIKLTNRDKWRIKVIKSVEDDK